MIKTIKIISIFVLVGSLVSMLVSINWQRTGDQKLEPLNNLFVSIEDPLHVVLPFIVPSRPPVIDTAVYQVLAKERHLGIASHAGRIEPLLQLLNSLATLYKARHCLAIRTVH